MRPTAEGLEEENREQPKPDAGDAEKPAESLASQIPAEPPADQPAAAVTQPEWHIEPTSPPPAPVFAESASVLPAPQELPAEEPRFDEEPFDEEDGEESEEMEASEAEPEGKEGESKTESRRRRSRGRRGGKKRAVRTAASPAEEEEEEESPREEPAYEAPAPRRISPVATPAPQYRVARGSDSYVIPSGDAEPMPREIIISLPERQRSAGDERKIALFCDFENIALGVRDSDTGKFEITLVLERLLEKGKIIVKKAYADWERYSDYKRPFHEAAIELIDIPQKFYSGKNSADIKMVVDAMDLSYSKEHLDTFVILSGDSDFSPLVSKLKENNKYVIGIGVKNSSSNLLVDNCDEFIYYEDVWRDAQKGPKLDGLNKKTAEAFSLMIESIQALIRENKDVLWGSMIKQTMQRKKPSFNEGYYGYSTFSELLEDAERKNIIKLKKDQRSGTYIVTGFAKTGDGATAVGRR
jgi:uncharacterized protein (TIGR00288 family)